MREGIYDFKDSVPAMALEEVKRVFLAEAWVIPPWCNFVAVHYNSDGHSEGAQLSCEAHYDYRWARVTVFPSWHDQDETIRRESVIHELLHIATAPLVEYASATVKTLMSDEPEKFLKHVEAQMTERVESVVCDLAYRIEAKTREPKP